MKMQPQKYRSIEEFLDSLPEKELKVTLFLRDIILSVMPEAEERLWYNVSMFKRRGDICFIWPASVLWGQKLTYTGVRLGFSKGYLLTDPTGYLVRGTRKQVYWRDFQSVEEIDIEQIRAFLFEAILIDNK